MRSALDWPTHAAHSSICLSLLHGSPQWEMRNEIFLMNSKVTPTNVKAGPTPWKDKH